MSVAVHIELKQTFRLWISFVQELLAQGGCGQGKGQEKEEEQEQELTAAPPPPTPRR